MDQASASICVPAPEHRELNELVKNGYCIVHDVVPHEMIEQARTALEKYFSSSGRYRYGGKCESWGLHISEAVSRVLSSPHVLEVVRRCTAPDPAILTEECFLIQNTTTTWHKDTSHDLKLGPDIYTDPTFKVYKIAIYLQDQTDTSPEVFKVKPGSHRHANAEQFPFVPVPMRAGDAVIFDVRIDHSGQLPTIAERSYRKLLNRIARYLPGGADKWFTRTRSMAKGMRASRPDRLAMIMTFGSAGPHTFNYEMAGRKRQGEPPSKLSSEIYARIATSGVEVIRMDDPRLRTRLGVI